MAAVSGKAKCQTAVELAGMHVISHADAKRYLPAAVSDAAEKVCTADGFLIAIATKWPWLAIAQEVDGVFKTASRKSNAGPYLPGINGLEAFKKWLGEYNEMLGRGSVTLLAAYSMAKSDGLIDHDDGAALIQRDMEAIERLILVLRHFAGVDDNKRSKKRLLPSVASLVADLHRQFSLSTPPLTDESPAVELMATITEALTGRQGELDVHRKALGAAIKQCSKSGNI